MAEKRTAAVIVKDQKDAENKSFPSAVVSATATKMSGKTLFGSIRPTCPFVLDSENAAVRVNNFKLDILGNLECDFETLDTPDGKKLEAELLAEKKFKARPQLVGSGTAGAGVSGGFRVDDCTILSVDVIVEQ